jgi:signal transduction histidine kinase
VRAPRSSTARSTRRPARSSRRSARSQALVDEFSQFARLPRRTPGRAIRARWRPEALALYQPEIEANRVRVEVDDREAPESMRADPEQLGRALRNVIQNALDANGRGGRAAPWRFTSAATGGPHRLPRAATRDPGFRPRSCARRSSRM